MKNNFLRNLGMYLVIFLFIIGMILVNKNFSSSTPQTTDYVYSDMISQINGLMLDLVMNFFLRKFEKGVAKHPVQNAIGVRAIQQALTNGL